MLIKYILYFIFFAIFGVLLSLIVFTKVIDARAIKQVPEPAQEQPTVEINDPTPSNSSGQIVATQGYHLFVVHNSADSETESVRSSIEYQGFQSACPSSAKKPGFGGTVTISDKPPEDFHASINKKEMYCIAGPKDIAVTSPELDCSSEEAYQGYDWSRGIEAGVGSGCWVSFNTPNETPTLIVASALVIEVCEDTDCQSSNSRASAQVQILPARPTSVISAIFPYSTSATALHLKGLTPLHSGD